MKIEKHSGKEEVQYSIPKKDISVHTHRIPSQKFFIDGRTGLVTTYNPHLED